MKVYSGAAKPIIRDAVHAADIHGIRHSLLRRIKRLIYAGESGLDGVTLLPQPIEPAATDVDHLQAMYNALIATPPNTAWLVSTGTLTNIGLLFQKYTDLANHLKGLSIMGGAVGGGFTDAPMGKVKGEGERFGNWTAYAEFNVSFLPSELAQWSAVLTSPSDLCEIAKSPLTRPDTSNHNSATLRHLTSSSHIQFSSPRLH